jgi:hypothetical protein
MRRNSSTRCIAFALGMTLLGLTQTMSAADRSRLLADLSAKIDKTPAVGTALKTLIKERLLSFCTDSVIVAAVKAQNGRHLSLDAIKRTDSMWIASDDDLPLKTELLDNDVSAQLQKLCMRLPSMSEVIVMDNQGANVGQNTLTSDYWQGDEPKFINAFNGGQGGIDIEKARLDKSTNRVDQKISLPIIDTDGTVIGAICIGLTV